MEQYIPKAAVVAEIERRYKLVDKYETNEFCAVASRDELVHIKNFIDTLEVTEVNLQSEIDRVWDNTSDNFSEDGWKEFEDIAKHFFELGLKARKGE